MDQPIWSLPSFNLFSRTFDEQIPALRGRLRGDLERAPQYCGMFLTPRLRNVATRHAFFHNGVYHTLEQVLDFYDCRDSEPKNIYPRVADGKIEKFNDLPARYRDNIDIVDPPFDRHLGETPAMARKTRPTSSHS